MAVGGVAMMVSALPGEQDVKGPLTRCAWQDSNAGPAAQKAHLYRRLKALGVA
jgi:hypothetical protein